MTMTVTEPIIRVLIRNNYKNPPNILYTLYKMLSGPFVTLLKYNHKISQLNYTSFYHRVKKLKEKSDHSNL